VGGGGPNRAKECVSLLLGKDVSSVQIEQEGPKGNWLASTRRNKIILYVPEAEFFGPGNEDGVLEEYYHVVEQWNTGRLNRFKYVLASWRGYRRNKYEVEAKKWTADHVQNYINCITRP
jgi:hypothetical protein